MNQMKLTTMVVITAGVMATTGLGGCRGNQDGAAPTEPAGGTAQTGSADGAAKPGDPATKPADPAAVNPIPVRIGNETMNIHGALTATDIIGAAGPGLVRRGMTQKVVWTADKAADPLRSVEFTFAADGRLDSAEWRFKPTRGGDDWPEFDYLLEWLTQKTGTDSMDALIMDKEAGFQSYLFEYGGFRIQVSYDFNSDWISIYRHDDAAD